MVSSQLWNISIFGGFTAFLGNLFLCLTTPTTKHSILVFILNFMGFDSCLLPLSWHWALLKRAWLLIFIWSFGYLYTLIRYPWALCSPGWTVSAFQSLSLSASDFFLQIQKEKERIFTQWSEITNFLKNMFL